MTAFRFPALPDRRLVLLLAVLGPLGAAPPALAATASVSGGVMTYGGSGNEVNQAIVLDDLGTISLTDPSGITPEPGCQTFGGGTQVICPGATSVVIDSGAGRDSVRTGEGFAFPITITDAGTTPGCTADAVCQEFTGGEGADTITDDSVPNDPAAFTQIAGRAGNDTLGGSNPRLFLFGEDGNDLLKAGGGRADFGGGPGFDRADYTAATDSVRVTVDGVANDGVGSRLDQVGTDVEAVSGGSANDALTGSDGPNTLAGFGGNDDLDGAGGNDFMGGGGAPGETETENDLLAGGTGMDTVTFSSLGLNGVRVTLDNQLNDGSTPNPLVIGPIAGNAGNVNRDVERVNGTNQADAITASDRVLFPVTLVGNGGLDTLVGSPGNDFLDGGPDAGNSLDCAGGDADTYRISSAPPGVQPTGCENGI